MLSAEDSDRSSSTRSSDESEDFEKHCTVCSLKYPTSHASEKCCSKANDSWVQCNSCDDWFQKVCLPLVVDIEKGLSSWGFLLYYFTLQNKNVFSMNKCSVIFS